MAANHKARSHAELGASSAHRWMACPGSVSMCRDVDNVETEYSREGTAAHEVAQISLESGKPATEQIGSTQHGVEVTEEMLEAVQVFIDHVRSVTSGPGNALWIEKKFDLDHLNPPGHMYGTADVVVFIPSEKVLHVIDYKHGQGYPVEVIGNPQLRYYALGALLSMPSGTDVETIRITIVQPRAPHRDGPIRSEDVSYDELVGFAGDLMDAARATLAPDAPLNAGRHCKFCPAKAKCPALQQEALAVARIEFSTPEILPPDPRLMPIEVVADLLAKAPILEDWLKGLRQHALNELSAGRPVPGYKLVAKRAIRKWSDAEKAEDYFKQLKLPKESFLKMELKSPAQLEKVVGKDLLPAEFVIKQSSGVNIAPEFDPRPAVTMSPGDEFTAIGAGDSE